MLCLRFLMLCPIQRAPNGLVPAGEQAAALLVLHGRCVQRVAPPELLQLVAAAPYTGGQSGEVARAERGRFADDRTADGAARNIALELHEEAVAARAAVHREGGKGNARIALHGGQQVVDLIRDGFLCGADDVLTGGAACQADEAAARVHIPVRRTEAGERRNKIHAARVLDLAGIVFGITALGEEPHFVAQPLDDRAADEQAALERILRFAAEPDADGGEQSVFALTGGHAGVHQQETAGAVGVLRITGGKTGLPEQRGLLVACDARNGYLTAGQRHMAVHLARGAHARQHGAGNIERIEQGVVPVEAVNVEYHRACGVGRIRDVDLAARQLPHEPRIHRAEQNLAARGLFACALDMIEQPLDLGAGEIRIGHEPGRAADVLGKPVLDQPVHNIGGAAALPHDGVVDGPSGGFIPQNGGFTLIGDADARHLGRGNVRRGEHLQHGGVLRGPYLHRVLLDPAFMRVVLGQLVLTDGENVLFAVKKDRSRARCALIERQYVLSHNGYSSHSRLALSIDILYPFLRGMSIQDSGINGIDDGFHFVHGYRR